MAKFCPRSCWMIPKDFQKMKLGEVLSPFLKRSLPESMRLLLRPRRLLLPILQFDLGQMYPGLWWPAWTFDGGANLAGLKLTLNFLEVPPFHDRCDFWNTMKEIVSEKCKAMQFNICYPLPLKERKYSLSRDPKISIDWKDNIKSYGWSSDNTLLYSEPVKLKVQKIT